MHIFCEKEGNDMSKYRDNVIQHLGNYKRNELGITQKGLYKYDEKCYLYDHILPIQFKDKNIIDAYCKEFYNSAYSNISPHRYFHHLNSSQAMCINFFYPLIYENLLGIITNILKINDEIDTACFEKVSDIESGANNKTNFDFYIKTKNDINIYFEIKYTEYDFAKAKKDDKHKDKYKKVYERLIINNPAINDEYKKQDVFLDNYQIMRNICHINEKNYVVFIYPYGNKKIKESAEKAKNNIITANWGNHFILLTWEDIIKKLIKNLNNCKLINYYKDEFVKKYFI